MSASVSVAAHEDGVEGPEWSLCCQIGKALEGYSASIFAMELLEQSHSLARCQVGVVFQEPPFLSHSFVSHNHLIRHRFGSSHLMKLLLSELRYLTMSKPFAMRKSSSERKYHYIISHLMTAKPISSITH